MVSIYEPVGKPTPGHKKRKLRAQPFEAIGVLATGERGTKISIKRYKMVAGISSMWTNKIDR